MNHDLLCFESLVKTDESPRGLPKNAVVEQSKPKKKNCLSMVGLSVSSENSP